MNLVYNLQIGKKSNQLMIRLYKNKFDVSCGIGISLDAGDWDQELQLANSSIINQKLSELKSNVLKAYNESFMQGTIIDKDFVKNIISECFSRPTKEISQVNSDVFVYYSDFANNWLKTKADQWKISAKQTMPKYLKKQYEDFLELFLDYEKTLDAKLVLKDLSIDDFYGFCNFCEERNYSSGTIKRFLSRMKFFCARCNENNVKVSSAYNQRVFIENDSDGIEGIYLNEDEIQKIYDLNLSDNYNLDHARDNFVLSCYTAIRVSDLMNNLDTSKIKEGIIRIKTIKTKTFVSIPMHNYVEQILNKRFGNLPCKFSDYDYNCYIKDICKLAKIDKITYGKLWDKEKKRKVIGNRPKYMYISSHTARKSFATNLIGKVSDEVLMSVAGWNTSEMLKHYNKASKDDNAKELKKYWLSKKE